MRYYKQGGLAGVTGSLGWAENNGNVAIIFKVGGMDFPNADRTDFTPIRFLVTQGFVTVQDNPVPPTNVFPCEDKMSFCATYWEPASINLYIGLKSNKLAVGFNRQVGGIDVKLPFDAYAAAKATPNEYKQFDQCIGTIIERAKANTK